MFLCVFVNSVLPRWPSWGQARGWAKELQREDNKRNSISATCAMGGGVGIFYATSVCVEGHRDKSHWETTVPGRLYTIQTSKPVLVEDLFASNIARRGKDGSSPVFLFFIYPEGELLSIP